MSIGCRRHSLSPSTLPAPSIRTSSYQHPPSEAHSLSATKMAPLLSVQGLAIRRDDGTGSAIFSNVSFDVEEGDVVIIRGRSGAGALALLSS